MPNLEPLIPSLLIAAVLLFMVWFALGTGSNVKRGNDLLRWLQDGLPALGERTALRWLGSSAVELHLAEPRDPFRDVIVLLVLEPRDVPFLWAFARSRGRRDFLVFRTSLRRAPQFELEAGDPAAWIGPPDLEQESGWRPVDPLAAGILTSVSTNASAQDLDAAKRAWIRFAGLSPAVWRLSIRRTVPHLEIHLREPDMSVSSKQLVRAVRELGVDLSRQS